MSGLNVFADRSGKYVLVGELEESPGRAMEFLYAGEYLASPYAAPISLSLPLRPGRFSQRETAAFFEGLLPEGAARRALSEALHTSPYDLAAQLGRLGDESQGGLVFSEQEQLDPSGGSYELLDLGVLQDMAARPRTVAMELGMRARLSLAGAEAKAGLFLGDNGTWYLPLGTAPSTHIVKASDGTFPGQTVNEAFCMRAAARCGFDAAEVGLLPVGGAEPLLLVRRFDRVWGGHRRPDGHEAVKRLHQEDFCQASGLTGSFKYEPTDGNYVSRCGSIIDLSAENAFGERAYFFQRIVFDVFIGNCDNHLKNHAMLWSEDWKTRSYSPLYDITCTTVYEALDREMGVSLCRSRKIDDVTEEDLIEAGRTLGVNRSICMQLIDELAADLGEVLEGAKEDVAEQYDGPSLAIVDLIAKDACGRLSRILA